MDNCPSIHSSACGNSSTLSQKPIKSCAFLHARRTMARPFDDQMSYHQAGSMSSQTSLAGAYGNYGQPWSARREAKTTSKKSSLPRLPKIKSSPSNGALAAARAYHGRHKRGNSASATPTSPTFVPDYLLQTSGSTIPSSAHADPYSRVERKPTKNKVKIKPLLRKFSSQEGVSAPEKVSIDLSRSAAENVGLDVYSASEISVAPTRTDSASTQRGYHNRASSANSQISNNTASSNHRYGAQYVHPMRQTPHPYTPPIVGSYQTSLDSDTPVASLYDNLDSHDASTPYAPLPSSRRLPTPLHIRTGSSPRLTSSSQTNLPGNPSSLRLHTDIISPPDMISPTSRSSLESSFRKRSRSNTATDPAAQAAAVQVLRQKFQEKEAAKDLKYQQAEARAQEREQKRQERRDEDERRTSERRERKRARSNATSEKSSLATFGRDEQHESFPPAEMFATAQAPIPLGPPKRSRTDTAERAGKEVQSQWTLFWFRFKIMWLRLRKKMGSGDRS